MLTIAQILEFEQKFTQNMGLATYWDAQLSKRCEHDEWMKIVHQRSDILHAIYLEDQEQVDILSEGMKSPMSDEVKEELYLMLSRIFYDGEYDDAVIMIRIADALLPDYELRKDHVKVLHLLNIKSWLMTEYFYRQTRHPEQYSYKTIHGKILKLLPYYTSFSSNERAVFMVNFYNIICVLPLILPHELNELLDVFDDFKQFIQCKEIIDIDRCDEEIQKRILAIQQDVWNMAENIAYFDQEHLLHFYKLVKDEYEQQLQDDNENMPYNLMAVFYYTSAYIQDRKLLNTGMQWEQAFHHLGKVAQEQLVQLEEMKQTEIDESFFEHDYYPYQETINFVFRIYPHIQAKEDRAFMLQLVRRGTQFMRQFPKGGRVWLIYVIQCEWCENALGVLEDVEEQHLLINNTIVKGQIHTYIHSQMVSLLARAILSFMVDHKPDLLLTLPWFTSIEDIRKQKAQILFFIDQASLLHDIGKNKISSVINQQMRRIVKEEIDLIREHPEHPESGLLKNTSNFAQYYDIIAGHHKSYDGKSGYPAYFDNVHSPYRILIDIVAICDSIDAATDRLGRNYAHGKSIREVLKELDMAKGKKYNPDVVDMMMSSDALQQELQQIVDVGRDEVYFHTYNEYLL